MVGHDGDDQHRRVGNVELVVQRSSRVLGSAVLVLSILSGCTKGSGPTTVAPSPGTASSTVAPTVSTTRTTSTTVAPSRTATIVLVVPASGANEGVGTEAREGLELALRHGVEDGHLAADTTLNVRVLDESAKGLARAVDRTIRNDNVIALFGGLTESTEGVLAPIARRRKVPLFTFSWRIGSEPADAIRIGPNPDALVDAAALAVVAANPTAVTLLATAVASTSGAVGARDQLVATLSGLNPSAPPFASIATSVPDDLSSVGDAPVVVFGSGQTLIAEYARIRPTPVDAPPSFIVPIDATGCGTRPFTLPAGTRCVSRGLWFAPSAMAKAFREDAAAALLIPSWATTVGYDGGVLLAALLGRASSRESAAAMRTRLLGAASLPALARFEGLNGKLTLANGYERDAQTLIARNGEWEGDAPTR